MVPDCNSNLVRGSPGVPRWCEADLRADGLADDGDSHICPHAHDDLLCQQQAPLDTACSRMVAAPLTYPAAIQSGVQALKNVGNGERERMPTTKGAQERWECSWSECVPLRAHVGRSASGMRFVFTPAVQECIRSRPFLLQSESAPNRRAARLVGLKKGEDGELALAGAARAFERLPRGHQILLLRPLNQIVRESRGRGQVRAKGAPSGECEPLEPQSRLGWGRVTLSHANER